MTLKIGDIIMVKGCGYNNICRDCKSSSCSSYIEGEYITARITEIVRISKNILQESPIDEIHFSPLNNSNFYIIYTQRKWCTLFKPISIPMHIIDLLL